MTSPDDDKTQSHVPVTSGTMVSHYRIIEKIGSGGMGEVYLAEDTKLNRKVALKFLPLHLCQDADCRARFKREAQAAAKLNHPNIVTIYEVSEFNGRPFFAMENIQGESLNEYVKTRKISWQEIIGLAIQLAEGMGEAHRGGVIHRDIKPSNILVDSTGRAKILDFGLAVIKGEKKLTKTGSTLGTLQYMSPEQTRGEFLDERSDIFSFGVVLYEMITGQTPFRGEHEPAIMYSIAYEEPEPLARYKSGVLEDCQRIVTKALTKRKDERYQHADELLADLKRLTSEVSAAPSQIKRNRRIVMPSLVMLGVLVAIVALRPWRMVIRPTDHTRVATKRVVVVPFRNQTGDTTLNALGRMVADWTTQSLLETQMAEIVPSEVLSGLDISKGTKSIVTLTGASLVVAGSYYNTGDSIQFQVQVMNSDAVLVQALAPQCAQTAKVMDGVEIVRQKVLGALAVLLDERLAGRTVQTTKPPKYEAYLEYVAGCDFHTQSDWGEAIRHHLRAYAIDTSFREPLFSAISASTNLRQYQVADSLAAILEMRRSSLTALQQIRLGGERAFLAGNLSGSLDAMRQAAQLAPGSAYAYQWGIRAYWVNRARECIRALMTMDPKRGWARGWMQYWAILTMSHHILGEHEEELQLAHQARDIYPDRIEPLCFEARALTGMGRVQEAVSLLEQCASQDKNPTKWMDYVVDELRRHGYEDAAMEWSNHAVKWYERRPEGQKRALRAEYAGALYCARRWREAKAVFAELAKESPDNIDYQEVLGCIAAREGDRAYALEVLQRLGNLERPFLLGSNTYWCACIAAILGDKETAVERLRESFSQGQFIVAQTWADFDLESLWTYPPYMELMKPKG